MTKTKSQRIRAKQTNHKQETKLKARKKLNSQNSNSSPAIILFKKHLQEFKKELIKASEDNDWEVGVDEGEEDEFRVIDGKEFINTQMQKHFGKELI